MENRIINKSAEMFLKHGFKSVTMDDIALEMGISKKTIYKYFKNKKELIKIVITQLIEKISYGIDFIFEMNLNPIDKLFTIKDFVTYYLKSESSSPFYQLQKYYPVIFNSLISNQFNKVDEYVIKNLKNGIEQGLFRNDINLKLISRFYATGINGIRNAELFNPIQFNNLEVQKNFLEYHLRGICTQQGINYIETIIKIKVNNNE